jgi:hypothetical protein
MDQTSPSDFDQKFELINPSDLISALVIETFRIEALQDGSPPPDCAKEVLT